MDPSEKSLICCRVRAYGAVHAHSREQNDLDQHGERGSGAPSLLTASSRLTATAQPAPPQGQLDLGPLKPSRRRNQAWAFDVAGEARTSERSRMLPVVRAPRGVGSRGAGAIICRSLCLAPVNVELAW
jgi:hypothetical protein